MEEMMHRMAWKSILQKKVKKNVRIEEEKCFRHKIKWESTRVEEIVTNLNG